MNLRFSAEKLIEHLGENSALRRRIFLGGTACITAVVLVITIALTVLALTADTELANRMAEVAAIFTGATLLLAVIAGVVALLAYAVSTGAPYLSVSVRFGRPMRSTVTLRASCRELS
jgi:hypothetical protein